MPWCLRGFRGPQDGARDAKPSDIWTPDRCSISRPSILSFPNFRNFLSPENVQTGQHYRSKLTHFHWLLFFSYLLFDIYYYFIIWIEDCLLRLPQCKSDCIYHIPINLQLPKPNSISVQCSRKNIYNLILVDITRFRSRYRISDSSSQLTISRPSLQPQPPISELALFTWSMATVLNRIKN